MTPIGVKFVGLSLAYTIDLLYLNPQNNYFRSSIMTESAYFTVETMMVDASGRKLGKGVPDKDGYYNTVPMAVLNNTTRNMTAYDTPSFIEQLKSGTIATRVKEGCLAGEWGHPFVDLNTELGLQRLMHIEPKEESNHIRSLEVKRIEDLGIDVVIGSTKPSGPYGKYFEEAMEDPTRNLAFSLRGLSKAHRDRSTGITHKKLVNLVTFDSGVCSSGFFHTTKQFMDAAAKEDLIFSSKEIIHTPVTERHLSMIQEVALESFTDTELNDLFKSTRLVIGSVVRGFVDQNTQTIFEPESKTRRSVFHSFLNVKR